MQGSLERNLTRPSIWWIFGSNVDSFGEQILVWLGRPELALLQAICTLSTSEPAITLSKRNGFGQELIQVLT